MRGVGRVVDLFDDLVPVDLGRVFLVSRVLDLELLWKFGVEQRGEGGLEVRVSWLEVVDVDARASPRIVSVPRMRLGW